VTALIPASPFTAVRLALDEISLADADEKSRMGEPIVAIWSTNRNTIATIKPPPYLRMKGSFTVPKYAMTVSVMNSLAALIGRDLVPSSHQMRQKSPGEGEGGAFVTHFMTVVKCIEEMAVAENIVHFVQLWMVLYTIYISTPGHPHYNARCAGSLKQHLAKRNMSTARYDSVALRLTAALLHHPLIVNWYLRTGAEPHFNVFTHSRSVTWLLTGENTPGAHIAATLKYAVAPHRP
jgi:hypothetical protein